MTLFTRLLLIIVTALLPTLAMQAFNESALRSAREADVRAQVAREARAVSAELQGIDDGVRNTLVALAEIPGIRAGDGTECPALLRAVAARFVFLRDLALVGADGVVRCDSAALGPRDRAADPAVRLARARDGFAIGAYAVDTTGRPVLAMGYPVRGQPGAVLVADFDLGWLRDQIAANGLPPGSGVTVADRDGRYLLRLPDRERIGTLIAPEYRWMLGQPTPGVVEATASDGVRRIAGYVPLAAEPNDLFVAVGFSTQYAYAASDAAAWRGYVLVAIGLIAALALAAAMMRGTVTAPVGAILATIERWRHGDTGARVALPGPRSEFSSIAAAVNDLLDTIVTNEAGLRARLAELDAVYRGSAVGLCFIDHDLRFVMTNATLAEINGIAEAEHRGRSFREVLPDIADREEPLIRRALAGEPTPPTEVFGNANPDTGMRRRLLVSYQPAVAGDGQVIGAVVSVQDITALRRAEADLQVTLQRANVELESRVAERTAQLETEVAEREAAQEQLRQAQKMELLGQLTGGVAHDFNNLLTAIIGNLELALGKTAERPDLQRPLRTALRAADRGASLTQRMLAFGRRQYLRTETVPIAPLLVGMQDLLARTIAPPVSVRIAAAEGMRPARADPNQVELVVLNLVVNARDAMPGGGVITITAAEEFFDEAGDIKRLAPGRYVRITVRDTGTGMDPNTQSRAFEPFFTTKPVGQGSGLGLSMVQGVAEQSGGGVTIESTPGHGTSVSVWLPCEELGTTVHGASPPTDIGRSPAAGRG
jgi:PAS domain S-box-containing protein